MQINLAPNDYPHARWILPHQIDAFVDQVDEVVLVLDTHRSSGRFGSNWDENLTNIKALIDRQCARFEKIRLAGVDYSQSTMKSVANYFFGTDFIPKKDYRGGPFYSYFFGLHQCNGHYVLHLDSDMLLGGGSPAWITEAKHLLSSDKNVFTCSPLPGPPHPQALLFGQPSAKTDAFNPYLFHFNSMSTRIFMIEKNAFESSKLDVSVPGVLRFAKAMIKRHPPFDLPERLLSNYMATHKLERVDFLGSGRGMWSLHPPYRNPEFYRLLPQLLEEIASSHLPAAQDGHYDIVDDICDWTDARQRLKNQSWWKKIVFLTPK